MDTTYYRGHEVCGRCFSPVSICYTKAGAKYLGETAHRSIHGGTFSPAHRCDLWSADDGALLRPAKAVADGELVPNQTVIIARGRKFPIGTHGTIVTVLMGAYGECAKVRLEDNSIILVSVKNLDVTTN